MIKQYRLAELNQVFSPVKRTRRVFFLPLLAGIAIFAMTAATLAGSDHESGSKNGSESAKIETHKVEVENFGKVTDFFYRGAQPEGEEYKQLAILGVKTVIDLRNDPKDFAKGLAQRAGLKYINFPMNDKAYPSSDAAAKFLSIVNNQENWPVYVHCAGGRHRTGAMTAVYRMTMQGWDIERAYEEMKEYDFYTRWGHKPIKQYVYDYYRDLQQKRDPLVISTN